MLLKNIGTPSWEVVVVAGIIPVTEALSGLLLKRMS